MNKIMYKHLIQRVVMCLMVIFNNIHTVNAQNILNKEVTLRLNNVSLKEAIKAVQNQTSGKFVYSSRVKLEDKISIVADREKLSSVLDRLLGPSKIGYRVINEQIILTVDKESIKIEEEQSQGATTVVEVPVFVIEGRVVDEKGDTLVGASVRLQKSTKGVLTGENGKYVLKMTENDKNDYLVFSFVGYEKQLILINGRARIDARLKESSALTTVVVIGYGSVIKRDVTGAVSSIKSQDIIQTAPINVEQALQGRVAGVQIVSSEGTPDAGINVRIRGVSSINASNSPLYVVDGFPIDGANKSSSSGLGNARSSPLSGINPSDIESIEVLKDASATAIYGSRGSNGVIIITTKSGKKGIPKVSVDMNYGVSRISKYVDVLRGQEFVDYYNELAQPTDLGGLAYRDTSGVPISAANLKTHDWQKEVFRQTYVSDNSVSISGGTDYTKYYAGLGYTNANGIVKGSDYQRFSLNLKLDQKIGPHMNLGINLTTAQISKNGVVSSTDGAKGYSGVINNIVTFRPVEPARPYNGADLSPDGVILTERNGELTNPDVRAREEKQIQTSYQTFTNVYLDYEAFSGLTLRSKFGGTYDVSKGKAWYPAEFGWGRFKGGGLAFLNHEQTLGWLNENTATYDKRIKNDHKIQFLAGFTQQKSNLEYFQQEGEGFQIPGINIDNIGSATRFDPNLNKSDVTQWTLQSGLARLNYSFKGKYLFTASIRRDGSSRFAEGKKWGTFPSAAVAWNIGDEALIQQKLPIISTLKLRSSFGLTGNQSIPLYQSQATLAPISYQFGSTVLVGLASTRFANQNLTWEKTRQFDVGLDIGILKDRFSLNVDYYKKNTFDLLLAKPISFVSGFDNAYFNIGSITNEGLEISLNTLNVKQNGFVWTTNVNISFNKNRVGSLGLAGTNNFLVSGLPYDGSYSDYLGDYIVKEGAPIGAIYGWKAAGVYQYGDFTNFEGLTIEQSAAKYADIVANGLPFILKSGVVAYKGNQPRPGYMKLADISGKDGVPDGVVDDKDKTIIGDPNPKHYGGLSNAFQYKGLSLDVLLTWSYGNDIYNKNLMAGAAADLYWNNQLGILRDRWTPTKPSKTMYGLNGRGDAGADRVSSFMIEDGSYLRLQNVTLSYNLAGNVFKKMKISTAKVFVSLNNLHVWTKYNGFDPEVSVGYNALTPGIDFASYPRSKNMRVGVSITF